MTSCRDQRIELAQRLEQASERLDDAHMETVRASLEQTSERIAYLSDIAWRRRHGQRPDPSYASSSLPLSALDATRVEQVVSALDSLAPQWNQLRTAFAPSSIANAEVRART